MDFMQFVDMILHVDKYFGIVVAQYGTLVYGVIFAIIFCETGLVVLPFLPGDTLLFIGGAFCANGAMNVWLFGALLIIAATSGNTVNYWIGRAIGQRVYTNNYRWLDQASLQRTHAFYERHGGKTIILSRFVPVIRTFAPFVAGVSEMTHTDFQLFNVAGAALWVISLVAGGYFFGNIPIFRDHLTTIILIGVGTAVIPVVLGGLLQLFKTATRK